MYEIFAQMFEALVEALKAALAAIRQPADPSLGGPAGGMGLYSLAKMVMTFLVRWF